MQSEKVLLKATLCFLRRDDEVLLARKLKKIGIGCLNGYGGGVEEGEDEKEATIRELLEEAHIAAIAQDLKKIAIVYFHNTKSDGISFVCECHVYTLWRWEGEPRSTKEMLNPKWFALGNLPLNDMMPADSIWLPTALGGEKIIATVHYGPFQKVLLRPVEVKGIECF